MSKHIWFLFFAKALSCSWLALHRVPPKQFRSAQHWAPSKQSDTNFLCESLAPFIVPHVSRDGMFRVKSTSWPNGTNLVLPTAWRETGSTENLFDRENYRVYAWDAHQGGNKLFVQRTDKMITTCHSLQLRTDILHAVSRLLQTIIDDMTFDPLGAVCNVWQVQKRCVILSLGNKISRIESEKFVQCWNGAKNSPLFKYNDSSGMIYCYLWNVSSWVPYTRWNALFHRENHSSRCLLVI